jgi:hypothetical protein
VKALEQLVIRARTRWRVGRAFTGGAARPARLVLRLDELDAPARSDGAATPAATLTVDGWYDVVVRVVEWAGALPVHLVARADNPLLPDMVRFAHRLECPTHLRTSASGLVRARAEELVDCGLERVVVRVAGVSDAVQGAVLGETVADTRAALSALLAARASREAALDIAIEVPFDARTAPELQALFEEARSVGIDGVRVAAPWSGGPFGAGALDALGLLAGQAGPFSRTSAETVAALRSMRGDGPGVARKQGACPVGALRLEVLPNGTLLACPFKGDQRPLGDSMAPAWDALAAHRDAIKRCDRACVHPELSP